MLEINKDIGWFIFIYTLILGIISYVISYFAYWKKTRITLDEYLFNGNNFLLGSFSIVGTIFSVAVYFTAIIGLYKLYGLIILPFTILPAVTGLTLLKILVNKQNRYPNGNNYNSISLFFQDIINLSNRPTSVFVYFLIYIFFMTVTEIGAFNNIINTYVPDDAWMDFLLLLAVFAVTGYVFISGFKGVLITDLFQMIVIVILLISILLSVGKTESNIQYAQFFRIPNYFELVTISIGCFVLCVSWFSSAPELLMRGITLQGRKEVKKAFYLTIILLPIIMSIPFIVMITMGIAPNFNGDVNEVSEVWKLFFFNNSKLFSLFLLMLLTTAFFTTLNTYLITFSQLQYHIKGKSILEKLFHPNIRFFQLFFVLIAVIIGSRLDTKWNSIIGVYAGSLIIPVFVLINVHPYLFKKLKNYPKFISTIWIQFIFSTPILYFAGLLFDNKEYSHLVYPLIPISVAFLELGALIIKFISKKVIGNED